MNLGGTDIPDDSLSWDYTLSSGPGGQNVNKVATAARLTLHLDKAGLAAPTRRRLERLAGSRLAEGGRILIRADSYRTRQANRRDALRRLQKLLEEAGRRPKVRRPTRPGKAARLRRLEAKKQRGETKRLRRPPEPD